jgi:hypothetical protein
VFQVRFHGQGVVTAAELLASAAFRADRYAQAGHGSSPGCQGPLYLAVRA